jgi:multicomponent Na+:H+ antiporter subunit B
MNENTILDKTVKLISPILLTLAFVVFWRGHQLPGGGFIGGLVAGLAIILRSIPKEVDFPSLFIGTAGDRMLSFGLAISLFAALLGYFFGEAFFHGQWLPTFYIPLIGKIHLGTPLLFDFGVFILVTTFCVKTASHFWEIE